MNSVRLDVDMRLEAKHRVDEVDGRSRAPSCLHHCGVGVMQPRDVRSAQSETAGCGDRKRLANVDPNRGPGSAQVIDDASKGVGCGGHTCCAIESDVIRPDQDQRDVGLGRACCRVNPWFDRGRAQAPIGLMVAIEGAAVERIAPRNRVVRTITSEQLTPCPDEVDRRKSREGEPQPVTPRSVAVATLCDRVADRHDPRHLGHCSGRPTHEQTQGHETAQERSHATRRIDDRFRTAFGSLDRADAPCARFRQRSRSAHRQRQCSDGRE